jgi:putative hydrolase of the HAD superfamily
MIKAVCFDFFNTLALFNPSREDFYSDTARKFGLNVTPQAIGEALPDADAYWRSENFKSPIREREEKEKYPIYTKYAQGILKGAQPPATPQQALEILSAAFAIGFKFVSFDDALPALKAVKSKGLKAGLVSNIGQEIESYCKELGFEPYLDFKVTSFEVGYDKPHPEIFMCALEKAGVTAAEAVFVGDQYDQDIIGSRNVGMKPIMIDRKGIGKKRDCLVISSLSQVMEHL